LNDGVLHILSIVGAAIAGLSFVAKSFAGLTAYKMSFFYWSPSPAFCCCCS
jgi:hypothetical protein